MMTFITMRDRDSFALHDTLFDMQYFGMDAEGRLQ